MKKVSLQQVEGWHILGLLWFIGGFLNILLLVLIEGLLIPMPLKVRLVIVLVGSAGWTALLLGLRDRVLNTLQARWGFKMGVIQVRFPPPSSRLWKSRARDYAVGQVARTTLVCLLLACGLFVVISAALQLIPIDFGTVSATPLILVCCALTLIPLTPSYPAIYRTSIDSYMQAVQNAAAPVGNRAYQLRTKLGNLMQLASSVESELEEVFKLQVELTKAVSIQEEERKKLYKESADLIQTSSLESARLNTALAVTDARRRRSDRRSFSLQVLINLLCVGVGWALAVLFNGEALKRLLFGN